MSTDGDNGTHTVLVRRRRTLGNRAKAKASVLTSLQIPVSGSKAAQDAGYNRSSIDKWRNADPKFDAMYLEAVKIGGDVIKDVVYTAARGGNLFACGTVLKWMGLSGDGPNTGRFDTESDFTIEELSRRALEQGFVSTPKPLKIIDGEARVVETKVT